MIQKFLPDLTYLVFLILINSKDCASTSCNGRGKRQDKDPKALILTRCVPFSQHKYSISWVAQPFAPAQKNLPHGQNWPYMSIKDNHIDLEKQMVCGKSLKNPVFSPQTHSQQDETHVRGRYKSIIHQKSVQLVLICNKTTINRYNLSQILANYSTSATYFEPQYHFGRDLFVQLNHVPAIKPPDVTSNPGKNRVFFTPSSDEDWEQHDRTAPSLLQLNTPDQSR